MLKLQSAASWSRPGSSCLGHGSITRPGDQDTWVILLGSPIHYPALRMDLQTGYPDKMVQVGQTTRTDRPIFQYHTHTIPRDPVVPPQKVRLDPPGTHPKHLQRVLGSLGQHFNVSPKSEPNMCPFHGCKPAVVRRRMQLAARRASLYHRRAHLAFHQHIYAYLISPRIKGCAYPSTQSPDCLDIK